jgi:chorismate mutase
VWLGARTVANPYMVKEISIALKGTKLGVMVKNPINPDLKLWMSALERIEQVGIENITAIHRGFSTYYQSPYRNMPLWEIPIELKRQKPTLNIISDPSHICGQTWCLQDIMQQAMDLEMQGLMIETHVNPSQAKSDSMQQITPKELQNILQKLTIRQDCKTHLQTLHKLRRDIDDIDDQLIQILCRRIQIVREIGKLKKQHQITVLQSERSRFLFSDRMSKAKTMNMNVDFFKDLLKTIHNEAIQIQLDILNNEEQT